jgi:hypothetical protein
VAAGDEAAMIVVAGQAVNSGKTFVKVVAKPGGEVVHRGVEHRCRKVSEHEFDDEANLAIVWLDVLRNRPGP